MTLTSPTRQFLHRLRVKNVWVVVFVACWMLLYAQMAVAGHRCSMQIDGPVPTMQHMEHTPTTQSADALCAKHCVPDGVHQESNDNLPVLAVPLVNTELRVADLADASLSCKPAWSSPPSTAPPAEIRFCRFRE